MPIHGSSSIHPPPAVGPQGNTGLSGAIGPMGNFGATGGLMLNQVTIIVLTFTWFCRMALKSKLWVW